MSTSPQKLGTLHARSKHARTPEHQTATQLPNKPKCRCTTTVHIINNNDDDDEYDDKRQTPNAKRRTPNAERQTTNAKRRTPNAERQTPNAKRQTPNAERQTTTTTTTITTKLYIINDDDDDDDDDDAKRQTPNAKRQTTTTTTTTMTTTNFDASMNASMAERRTPNAELRWKVCWSVFVGLWFVATAPQPTNKHHRHPLPTVHYLFLYCALNSSTFLYIHCRCYSVEYQFSEQPNAAAQY